MVQRTCCIGWNDVVKGAEWANNESAFGEAGAKIKTAHFGCHFLTSAGKGLDFVHKTPTRDPPHPLGRSINNYYIITIEKKKIIIAWELVDFRKRRIVIVVIIKKEKGGG